MGAVLGPVYRDAIDAIRSDTPVKWIPDSELLIVLVKLAPTHMISKLIERMPQVLRITQRSLT